MDGDVYGYASETGFSIEKESRPSSKLTGDEVVMAGKGGGEKEQDRQLYA